MAPQTPRLSGLMTAVLLAFSPLTSAYTLDPNNTDSVKTIAKSMADDMLSFYHGNEPGNQAGVLPGPYYWWEAGAMLGSLVDYWYYTKDDSYVDLTINGLQAQVGAHNDYMPDAVRQQEGNDDQGFWGLAVMSAAENNFPNPPKADQPGWLALAQAVFNTQAPRWEPDTCDGGLRWQIYKYNKGFNYKNSISQGCFFALGARLALYTGNHSYADWAVKTWDWMEATQLIDPESYWIYDGAGIEDNCKNITKNVWSYNAGVFVLGAAAMYNLTGEDLWKNRLDKLLVASKIFFPGPNNNVMAEVICESVDRCNIDERSFKAYLSRWLAATTKWAPHTSELIMPLLRTSAVAAAKQCVGGANGRMCGLIWTDDGKYDGKTGVGEQMAAMEVTLSCMIAERAAPVTDSKGGTSKGDASAGGDDIGEEVYVPRVFGPLGASSVAAAAILTIVMISTFIAGIVWLFLDETSDKSTIQQMRGVHHSTAAAFGAFTFGSGAAAVIAHRRNHGDFDEKGSAGQVTTSASERSASPPMFQTRTPDDPALRVGHVRHASSGGHQRRLSNMPRGWPHNQSVRGSALFESGSQRPTSTQAPSSEHSVRYSNEMRHSRTSDRMGPSMPAQAH